MFTDSIKLSSLKLWPTLCLKESCTNLVSALVNMNSNKQTDYIVTRSQFLYLPSISSLFTPQTSKEEKSEQKQPG